MVDAEAPSTQGELDMSGGHPCCPRPDRDTASVRVAAAKAFVEGNASALRDFGSPGDFARDLLKAAKYEDDAYRIAKNLEREGRYETNADFVEVLEGWGHALWQAAGAAEVDWVSKTKPPAPFEGVARVRTSGRNPLVGRAYRDARNDARGSCVVVPDGEDRPDGGGYVIAWERLVEVSPPTESDVAADRARLAREAENEEASRRSRLRQDREAARRSRVRDASRVAKEVDDAGLRSRLAKAARALADSLDAGVPARDIPEFDEVVAVGGVILDRSDRGP